MAGFIFALNNINALDKIIENGYYGTLLTPPGKFKSTGEGYWQNHNLATFGDYFSMKPGDNVYFFIKRKIYGIGKLAETKIGPISLNFKDALNPNADINKIEKSILKKKEGNKENRLVCYFEPEPLFFKEGIDMDDVLSSSPDSFKMLRAFWKLSFVKIDHEENKALKNNIIKRNKDYLNSKNTDIVYKYNNTEENLDAFLNEDYFVDDYQIVKSSSSGKCDGYMRYEMAIEASLMFNLTKNTSITRDVFGEWDYISHQVVASPFKAIDYMDKMDIFGYRFISGYKIISDYLLIEVKKDTADNQTVDQLMKYVDWINQEYAQNDYDMINAFIVAKKIPDYVIDYAKDIAVRNFSIGTRPTISKVWNNVTFVEYYENDGELNYKIIK